MSRVGKQPVTLPSGTKVEVTGGRVSAQGPNGTLSQELLVGTTVRVDGDRVVVERDDDSRFARSRHGLMRRLVSNLVEGVTEGFSKRLEITGVGYRAESKGDTLTLSLGFSHPVVFKLPEGVTAKVEGQTSVVISGADRQMVGEVAAGIRKLRPPEPYKGKGVRYSDERVRRKAGKAAAGSA